jgi:hypothetical protein
MQINTIDILKFRGQDPGCPEAPRGEGASMDKTSISPVFTLAQLRAGLTGFKERVIIEIRTDQLKADGVKKGDWLYWSPINQYLYIGHWVVQDHPEGTFIVEEQHPEEHR